VAGGEVFASTDLFSIPLTKLRDANEAWLPAFMG
jgi:phosphoribosylformylglycinamidine synthase